MAVSSFSITLFSNQTAEKVFQAILNVRDWWSGFYGEEFMGETKNLNDEFSFNASSGAHYSKQKIIEVIPNKKVVWLITDSKLSFIEKTDEWIGTKVIFEISEKNGATQLSFTHEGLTPEIECYDSCAPAWTQYLQQKLQPMIQ
jgi:hypothetical protein